jgi:uncharacterized protein YqjF (DUF2071 family)
VLPFASDFNHAILTEVAHRPWPVPAAPWLMTQTWHDLLFAHWPVQIEQLRSRIPNEFELDLFDGTAWVGVVPFRMTNVAPRSVPSLPFISAFPELNVRTYVRVADKPGVYFFSLDAGSSLAVLAARSLLNLPYYWASMTVTADGSTIKYDSRRRIGGSAGFRATYRAVGPRFTAPQGSFEYFLTERYCLYHSGHRGAPYRMEIHHPPWSLQRAETELASNSMGEANSLALPSRPPILHFSRRQDMVAWAPSPL